MSAGLPNAAAAVANMSEEDNAKLNDAIADGIDPSKPAVKQSLKEEITALTGVALEVDDAFFKIEARLKQVNTAESSDSMKREVKRLLDEWVGHRKVGSTLDFL